jgi:hypothetical protein
MIRKGIALFTGLILGLSSAALVKGADEPKPERKPGAPSAERKPGERKPGERPAGGRPDMQEILKKFDKDGDGKLNDAERAEAMKARGGAPGAGGRPDPARMQELIKKFDKDGDGKLSDAERQEAMKARGAAPGGKPGEGGRPSREELIKKFDKNGDGQLDEAERAEAMKARGGNGQPRKRPENK